MDRNTKRLKTLIYCLIFITSVFISFLIFRNSQVSDLKEFVGSQENTSPLPSFAPGSPIIKTPAPWQSYTDPENIYSIKIPGEWLINKEGEKGNNLSGDQTSQTIFQAPNSFMFLKIAKLYSHNPEYTCKPQSKDYWILSPPIGLDGYKAYQAHKINIVTNGEKTSSYSYCFDVKGKKLHVEFVPNAITNNVIGIKIFYEILETIKFN